MAKRSFRRFVEQELGWFPLFFIYAVLEWMLIIVLFLDGFLAFFANEFAKFFELRIPCLLCTRIDHILVHRDFNFYYNDSICESHKKDVSSLAYCHVHKKLSDIRNMCDTCLLSFATGKESDCGTYKSLVGILHKDVEFFVNDDREIHLALPATRNKEQSVSLEKTTPLVCSCCGEAVKLNENLRDKKMRSRLSQAPASSPRAPYMALRNDENRKLELPHIRYTQLKLRSDNDSEIQDDDDNTKTPLLAREDIKTVTVPLLESEEIHGDRTPLARDNKFFGISLTDSANSTPRCAPRIRRKSLLEKTEFASESAEINESNDQEVDSIVQHLKRQVRLDRKSLMALYMELDEERSASTVAANNAMAMITRLQAEKAAVQMEALQYQRMMEEQEEYDQEALQAANLLLAKKDEEIKDLTAELEAYRSKYGLLDNDLLSSVMPRGEGEDDLVELQPSFSTNYESSLQNTSNIEKQSTSQEQDEGEDQMKQKTSLPVRRNGLLDQFRYLDSSLPVSVDGEAAFMETRTKKLDETDDEGNFKQQLSRIRGMVKLLQAYNAQQESGTTIDPHEGSTRHLVTQISDNLQKLYHLMARSSTDDICA